MNNESLKSEKIIVALMLRDAKYIRDAIHRGLNSGYFSDQILKYFYEMICEYYSQHKSVLTENVLDDVFKSHNRPKEEQSVIISKYKILTSASHVNDNDFSYNIEKLLNCGVERDIMSTIKKVFGQLKTNTPDKLEKATDILLNGALKVARVGNSKATVTIRDFVDDYNIIEQNIVNRNTNPENYRGVKCYIDEIDRITGGFRAGEMTLFCAETGGGKTTTMMNIAHGIYKPRRTNSMNNEEWNKIRYNGNNVLYVNMEVPEELFGLKMTAMDARIPFNAMAEGILNKDRVDAIINAKKERQKLRSKFKAMHVVQQKRINTGDIESYIKEIYSYFQPKVVCIDYLALINPLNKSSDRRQELGDICVEMRAMGNRYGFHTISLAQIKRESIERIYKGKEADLMLTDIGESSLIADHLDNAFGLLGDRECEDKLWLWSLKNRNGRKVPKFHLVWIRPENWIGSSGSHFPDKEYSNISSDKRDSFLQISKELSNKKPEDIRRENQEIIEREKSKADSLDKSSLAGDDEDFFISDKSVDDLFDDPKASNITKDEIKKEHNIMDKEIINLEDDHEESKDSLIVEPEKESNIQSKEDIKELDEQQKKLSDDIMRMLNGDTNSGDNFIDNERRKDW